jgi:hypothetical protein
MSAKNERRVKHTHVKPKTRVRVTLHDGTVFTDHYLDHQGHTHVFKERGKVKSSLVYQLTIMPKAYEMQNLINQASKARG